MYDVLYSPYKEQTVMVQKYSEKATSPKKQNKGEKKEETHVWLLGRIMHIEE